MREGEKRFEAGKILKNYQLWKFLKEEVKRKGGGVDPIIDEAIERGSFDITHKQIFNSNKTLFFNNRFYQSVGELLYTNIENYNGVERYRVGGLIDCKKVFVFVDLLASG